MAPMTYHTQYFTLALRSNRSTLNTSQIVNYCVYTWQVDPYFSYSVVYGTCSEFLPLLVITVTYIIMFQELNKPSPHLQGNPDQVQIKARQMKLMRIQKKFIIIVGAFFTLTLPYSINFIIGSYWAVYNSKYLLSVFDTMGLLHEILFILATCNSCANPLIYGKWRKLFKRTCCRWFASQKSDALIPLNIMNDVNFETAHCSTTKWMKSQISQ